jgi:segregation and condensation protein B
MSLKAKLEAVIYAAEEPVTLNQLAALFADEALEWRAEQESAAAEVKASAPASAAEPHSLLTEAFDYLEFEQGSEVVTPLDEGPQPGVESGPESVEIAAPEAAIDAVAQAEAGADAPIEPPADVENAGSEAAPNATEEPPVSESPDPTPELSLEETAKQAARQREREVRLSLRVLLDELIEDYATDGSGIEIREIAGGYRMATKPEYHDAVRSFVKSLKPALKLSLPALETLAVIAYKQPVTAPEVNEIRGVDSSAVFGSLLARKLIATAGRKPVVGRPILYKTTREFLLRFGLRDLSELPSMEEFEKMAASEFEETEVADAELDAPVAEEMEQENPAEIACETGAAETAREDAPATEEVTAEAPNTTLE